MQHMYQQHILHHLREGPQPWCAAGRPSRRCKQFTRALQRVFSISWDGLPAFHPRQLLMLAGDVESNPGPLCTACKKAIRNNTVPVRRWGEGVWRGSTQPVLASRGGRGRGDCSSSVPGVARLSMERSQPTLSRMGRERSCWPSGVRNQAEKRGSQSKMHEISSACTQTVHRKEGWMCGECEGPQDPQGRMESPPTQPQAPMEATRGVWGTARHSHQLTRTASQPQVNKNCTTCEGRLRKVHTPLICLDCRREFHFKCARGQRLALELEREADTWRCEACTAGGGDQDPAPSDSRNRIQGPARTGSRRGLRLLQWNCDWLGTKCEELRELMQEQ